MINFRIQKHCDDLLTFSRSRACTNKMASASATPSSRDLQLIEGNSDGEHRPVPSPIAWDRSLESTSANYKRWGNSNTTKVLLHEWVKQFPGENLIVSYFAADVEKLSPPRKVFWKSIFHPRSIKTERKVEQVEIERPDHDRCIQKRRKFKS